MTYVVTENCIKCKYTECVPVCPVDCFHETPEFLVIDPDECIECALCIVACPTDAIFALANVPADQQEFIEINRSLSRQYPRIREQKAPMPETAS